MRLLSLSILFLFQAGTAAAQSSPAVEDLLRRVEKFGLEAAQLRTPSAASTVAVPAGADLQAAIDAAADGAVLALEPGATYGGVTIKHPVTLTTKGWNADRLVTPADAPALATIQGRAGYGAWIRSNGVTLIGLQVLWNLPSGAGELVRVGDAEDPNLAHVPADVTLRQLLLRGSDGSVFGQKRGISANGRNLLIDQVWCDRVWIAGQDSQCVAIWSTPGPVTTRRSMLQAGSENWLVGGTPPASPAHLPEHILLEDTVLLKPLAWKGQPRQVKNLVEAKFGRHITIRHNWLENNWPQAQPGPAVLITMAINGRCTFCELSDVTFADNIVRNVASGINILGHQYTLAYGPSGQAHGLTIRNNLLQVDNRVLGGDGRAIAMGSEPKDISITGNTLIYTGNSFVNTYYGKKFPVDASTAYAAGPVAGFEFRDNVTRHSNYGIFTPDGSSGLGLPVYFPGGVIAGNVIAGAPSASKTRYDATSGGTPNIYPDMPTFDAAFDARYCQKAWPGKGADCARLPFELRRLVPQ